MFIKLYKFFTSITLVDEKEVIKRVEYISRLQDRIAELEQRLRVKKKAKYLKKIEVKDIEMYFVGRNFKVNKDVFLELSIKYDVSTTTIKRIYCGEHKLSTDEYKKLKGDYNV